MKDRQHIPEYVRTKPAVIKQLKAKVKHRPVKEVEPEMTTETSYDFWKQKHEKLLNNIIYEIKEIGNQPCYMAKQVMCVEEMTKSHQFVQRVKHLNVIANPVVTLYTTQ